MRRRGWRNPLQLELIERFEAEAERFPDLKPKMARGKHLRAGYAYTEIGRMLGIGKSHAYRLVNDA